MIAESLSPVYYQDEIWPVLDGMLNDGRYSQAYLLVDSNTMQHCVPHFLAGLETHYDFQIIEMEPGEEAKTLEVAHGIFGALLDRGVDRKALVINLGGGIVTDMGGFIASTIKRGVDFVHVPTTLLGMVDAAIGGKNGVNHEGLKNQIGCISMPLAVFVHTAFLNTLPQREFRSGYAEILKHGLIDNREYYENALEAYSDPESDILSIVQESISIKSRIASSDPTEQGARKALNFGHTLGHAIESLSHSREDMDTLFHGEAVAAGALLAIYLSQPAITNETVQALTAQLSSIYGVVNLPADADQQILELLAHDKKNVAGTTRFVLLDEVGKFSLDHEIGSDRIREALQWYRSLA